MQDEKGGVPGTSVLLDYNVDFCWTRLVISRVSDSRIIYFSLHLRYFLGLVYRYSICIYCTLYELVNVNRYVENESLVQNLVNVIQARSSQLIYFLTFC